MSDIPSENAASSPLSQTPLAARLSEAASHTVIYGVGSIGQALLSFVLLAVYTRQLGSADFGLLSLLTIVGTLAGAVFYVGATSALSRYYFEYDDPERRRAVVGTAVVNTGIGSLMQIALGVALSPVISRALAGDGRVAAHVAIAISTTAVTSFANILLVVLRFERRSRVVVTAMLAGLAVTVLTVWLLLVQWRMGIAGALLGVLVGQVAMLGMLSWSARAFLVFRWSAPDSAAQLRFGIPNVLSGVAYYGLDSTDRFFIERFASLSDVGIYSAGYRVGLLIQAGFIVPFAQIWAPMRMQYGKDPLSQELFRLGLTYYVMVGLALSAVILAFLPTMMPVLFGRPEYYAASAVVPFVLLGHLAFGATNIVDYGAFRANRVIYHVYVLTGALALNALLNYYFVPIFGYMAAAYATLLCYLLVAIAMAVLSRRFYQFEFEWARLGSSLASAVLAFVTMTAFPHPGISGLLARFAVVGLLALTWYQWMLQDRERRRLAQWTAVGTTQIRKLFGT